MQLKAVQPASKENASKAQVQPQAAAINHTPQPVSGVAALLSLQCTHGNRFVQQLLRSKVAIQPKLAVSQPGDEYEQEADQVADMVMSMPASPVNQAERNLGAEALQTMPSLSRSAEDVSEIDDDLENRLSQSRGEGSPLPDDVRTFLEPRLGYDFSQVRVHAGSGAAHLNRALAAQAFTHGSNIYFGDGKYDPGSVAGKHLLAHELTHVVQQTGGVQAKQLADQPDVQMKCAACEAEEEIQRSIDISSALKLIQRKEVCNEWGGNCQSVPDEEGYTPQEQNFTPVEPDISTVVTPAEPVGAGTTILPPSSSSDIPSPEPITEPLPTLRSPGVEPPGGEPRIGFGREPGRMPGEPPSLYGEEPRIGFGREPAPVEPEPISEPITEPLPRSWPNAPDTLRSPGNELEGGTILGGIGLGAALVGLAAGAATFLWSKKTAPAWMDEINPITRQPYRNQEEYDKVHGR